MRVLATCLPGHGHFNPLLPVAQALVAAGHEVAFSSAGEFCPRVVEAGFDAFPSGLSLGRQMEQARSLFPEQDAMVGAQRFESFVPRMLAGVAAPARLADLVPVVQRWRPDLLLHDETELAAPLAATIAGVPYAEHSVGILRPLAMARLAGTVLAQTAQEHGVDVGPFAGLFRYLYLDVAPPSLQTAEISQVAVAHRVQNVTLAAGSEGDALPGWAAHLPDRPVVYVSLGTVFNSRARGVFVDILDGLATEPVTVIVTIGHGNDPTEFGPQPEHVHIERFIPQSQLLPFCDVVVNQGGTAILPILAAGLPLLVLPQGANQFHNAEACVAAEVGRRLLPAEVSPEAVRSEVHALLDDPRHRDAAQRIAKEITEMPAPEHAVELLEQLAQERRPLTRSAA